jgi:hypothetical protein
MYLEYHTVVVLCQIFWFLWEIVFGTYVNMKLWCCVSWFWQEIVFVVTYVLSVQYSCAVVFLKNDYLVSLFLEKQLARQNIYFL